MAAASELFYREGVNTVGIERVLEHAGVAKATLYSAFGSKEGLVRAYLRARHAATTERMARELEARYKTPKERLVGVFEVQGLSFTDPDFRGCAFLSANAQAPPGSIDEETSDYRAWIHQLFFDLAQQAGPRTRRPSRNSSSCSSTAPASAPGWTTIPAPKPPPAPSRRHWSTPRFPAARPASPRWGRAWRRRMRRVAT